MKMFTSLPAYFGSKRRFLGQIFKDLPGPDRAETFVDAFLCGESASLYTKARCYRVVCNDVAERSYIVCKPLIENGTVPPGYEDLARPLVPNLEESYAEKHFTPDVFPDPHARHLDLFLAHARRGQ